MVLLSMFYVAILISISLSGFSAAHIITKIFAAKQLPDVTLLFLLLTLLLAQYETMPIIQFTIAET